MQCVYGRFPRQQQTGGEGGIEGGGGETSSHVARYYYRDVCSQWDQGKIDNKTYWVCGPESESSVFNNVP